MAVMLRVNHPPPPSMAVCSHPGALIFCLFVCVCVCAHKGAFGQVQRQLVWATLTEGEEEEGESGGDSCRMTWIQEL